MTIMPRIATGWSMTLRTNRYRTDATSMAMGITMRKNRNPVSAPGER